MVSCRLLPYGSYPGSLNMGMDEACLHFASTSRQPTLRFYTWAEPTLSLGYFQGHESKHTHRDSQTCLWLRRNSGGGAILHHHELTYCLVIPPGTIFQVKESWLCLFHHLIRSALRKMGHDTEIVEQGCSTKLGDFLCFLHHTPGDLLCQGHKIAGSAQRKWHGATMQHGSILIRKSPYAPALPGLEDLNNRPVPIHQFQAIIIEELKQKTGWAMEDSAWSEVEHNTCARLAHEKYDSPTWNLKR